MRSPATRWNWYIAQFISAIRFALAWCCLRAMKMDLRLLRAENGYLRADNEALRMANERFEVL